MASRSTSSRAFSLIELVIVVVIIGVIGAIAIPRLSAFAANSEHTAVGEEINRFETAFRMYKQEHGTWPSDKARGVVPPEMVSAGLLRANDFDGRPLGGQYDWQDWSGGGQPQTGVFLGISGVTDIPTLRKVDEMIGDGDITTGTLFKTGQWTLFVMER